MRFDLAITKKYNHISRSRAAQRIKNGDFAVNGRTIKKPSYTVHENDRIEETSNSIPFVSRGGLKLEAAINRFSIRVQDQVCMDVGASTGGFTQCLLNHHATKVYAIDVGTSQLENRLRDDPRVVVLENRDIRNITPDELNPQPSLVVADVSFISLRKIWNEMSTLAQSSAEFVVLFKPQFETEKKALSKHGVVSSPKIAYESLARLLKQLQLDQFFLRAMIPSPIQGKQGNVEFLLHINYGTSTCMRDEEIKRIVFAAYHKGEKQ